MNSAELLELLNQIRELESVQIINPALPPQRPVSVISPKIIVLGAVVSFMAGVLLTFLLEYLEVSGTFRDFQKKILEMSELTTVPDNSSQAG